MPEYLKLADIKALKVGDRVAFPTGAESYPDFFIKERIEGTVSETDDECVWVKCDKHYADLDEWDNQIQIWLWSEEELAHNVIHLSRQLIVEGLDAYGDYVPDGANAPFVIFDPALQDNVAYGFATREEAEAARLKLLAK
jgi:hypothetical protein